VMRSIRDVVLGSRQCLASWLTASVHAASLFAGPSDGGVQAVHRPGAHDHGGP